MQQVLLIKFPALYLELMLQYSSCLEQSIYSNTGRTFPIQTQTNLFFI